MRGIRSAAVGLVLVATVRAAPAQDAAGPAAIVWESKEGPPPWTDGATDDTVRGVTASQSDGLDLAVPRSDRWMAQTIAVALAWRLRPLLGEAADAFFGFAPPSPPRLRRAYHLTPPRRGDTSPGAQTYTVWTLWEVPLSAVLEKVPPKRRAEASKALARAEPEDAPAWETVSAVPEWATPAAPDRDTWTFLLETSADRGDVARAQSTTLAAGHVAWSVVEPLRALLGAEPAWDVGRRAATWRRCTHRATGSAGGRPTTWARYEIPLARVLAAVPPEKRDAARALLVPEKPANPDPRGPAPNRPAR